MTTTSIREVWQPLYDALVRSRVVRERHFGKLGFVQRLLRIRLRSALLLSAPALMLCVWYTAAALATHYRQQAVVNEREPLTLELFQLHLHDRLAQDWRRLPMADALGKSPLPTYGLVLGNDQLDQLNRSLPPGEGPDCYVEAHLTHDNEVYPVKVRYRGRKPWHWDHPQKSWKVRVRGGHLFEGRATFNFINTPEPMPFDEHLILGIARDAGLLAPDYYPFRFFLNNAYFGVYFFETQPDEGLLRHSRRMPGSIYSGNSAPIDPTTKVSSLFASTKSWRKVAAHNPHQFDDFSELEALLAAINDPSYEQFAEFAERHLDLEKFALFDALDVVFGTNEHDFGKNHKLYFDPYRGRFEPIAWGYRGGQNKPELNRTEHPLLLRLKQLPEYTTLRNRQVVQLLRGAASPGAVRRRAETLLEELRADQERDPYWDAYEQLPALSKYYRQLVRPMNRYRQRVAVEARLGQHAERHRYLRSVLEAEEVDVQSPADQTGSGELALDLLVGGVAGYQFSEIELSGLERCQPVSWDLFADTNLSDELEVGEDRLLVRAEASAQSARFNLTAYPGVRLIPRPLHPTRGNVNTTPSPQRYRLFVNTGGCQPQSATIYGTNLVTDEPVTLDLDLDEPLATAPVERIICPTRFSATPGQTSPHSFCRKKPRPTTITLGPGTVDVPTTRRFGPDETVVVRPGTTFRMGDRASLYFHGRLQAVGRLDAPIRFLPARRRWGGIVLQGQGTAGSVLAHVEVRRGTRPPPDLAQYPGMVNIHDTRSIEIRAASFGENTKSDDAVHGAYVTDISIHDVRFWHTAQDALDLEFSSGTVEDLTVVDAGDDGVDLMGADVVVRGARLIDCLGNAISAGEQSEVTVEQTLTAGGTRGVLIKNASSVSLAQVLLAHHDVGVRIEPRSVWYAGKNHLRGDALYAVDCTEPVMEVNRKLKRIGRVATELAPDDLIPLRQHLGLQTWGHLDGYLDQLREAPP